MPVEDWIEKWTDMCVREMTTLAENQKTMSKDLSDNQKRMEDKHETRMKNIEDSIAEIKVSNAAEFKNLNTKLDEFIRLSNEKSDAQDKTHSVSIAEIKTKLAVIAGGVGLVAGAFISWIFGLIKV